MSENAFDKMKNDKTLDRDISKATTFEDLRAILENATVRSGIAERDPQTGRFVRRDPLTPAQNQPAESSEDEGKFKKTIAIAGKDYEVTGSSELDLEQNIGRLLEIAENARHQAAAAGNGETRVVNLDGISDPIKQAVRDILQVSGFDVQRAAAEQYESDWAGAVQSFLESDAGAGWPGGQRNLEIAGQWLQAHGKTNAVDKQAALAEMFADLRVKGMLFEGDLSDEAVIALTDKASPQEILEAWKSQQPDAESANKDFLNNFNGGRFFDK